MNYTISLAVLWSTYPGLNTRIESLKDRVPFTHQSIPAHAHHCTLFAIGALAEDWCRTYETPTMAIRAAFARLPFDQIEEIIKRNLAGLAIQTTELHIYENSSSIQFKVNHGKLEEARNELRNLLRSKLPITGDGIRLNSLLADKNKNFGTRLFGSFARRIESHSTNDMLHKEPLHIDAEIIRSVQLTTSDEALTNPRTEDLDYRTINLS